MKEEIYTMKRNDLLQQKVYIICLWLFWLIVTIHRYKTGTITILHYILAGAVSLFVLWFLLFFKGNDRDR